MSPHAGEILDDTLGKEILYALSGKCGRVMIDGHEVLDPESFLRRHLGLVWRVCSILGVSCVSEKNETLDWLMHSPYRLRT